MNNLKQYINEKLKVGSNTKVKYHDFIDIPQMYRKYFEDNFPFEIETQNHKFKINKYEYEDINSLNKRLSSVIKFYEDSKFIFSCNPEELDKIFSKQEVKVWGLNIERNTTWYINIKVI